MGDAFLVEFDSALEATLCAVEIQKFLHEYNISSSDSWKIKIRIGIHLGDVVKRDGDIFGDAVNLASRLQPLAEPEGVCISGQVFDQVKNKVTQSLVKLEKRDLKGIRFPVDMYKVTMPWAESGTQLPESASKNRIAVLPFANMSPDPSDEYFADGMTEELIDRLAQIKEIEVIARTSVMSYKKREKSISEIARELEVVRVVEGSVRKAGDRIRVVAQLISGATQAHLWSSRYDGNLDDIFAVQSEIAEKVAEELKVQLLQSEKETLGKKHTDNMEAYNYFLRGRELLKDGSELSVKQALKLCERAVELDPSFARAHVGVAECHQALSNFAYEPWDVMLPAVRASLKRALELDPDLADAHASLALLHFNEDDFPRTEFEARKALELNRNLPQAYHMLSQMAAVKGKPEEMLRELETAYRLDPIRPLYIRALGYAYFETGREEEALNFWKKTEHLDPAGTFRNMTEYHLSKGDISKAKELHSNFEQLQPADPWVTYMGGFIDAVAGDREKALQAIRRIEERKMGPTNVALVYYALGDMDRCFENLNKALKEHTLKGPFVMYSPLLTNAREDSRFAELLEKGRRQTGLVN